MEMRVSLDLAEHVEEIDRLNEQLADQDEEIFELNKKVDDLEARINFLTEDDPEF
jgi:cell division protein FtsB